MARFNTLPAGSSLLRPRTPVGAVRRDTAAEQGSRDWKAYVESRRNLAEQATGGRLVNPAGRARGISSAQWFTGKTASTKYATQELRDWLEANGPTLSPTAYQRQSQGMVNAPRASSYAIARMSGS